MIRLPRVPPELLALRQRQAEEEAAAVAEEEGRRRARADVDHAKHSTLSAAVRNHFDTVAIRDAAQHVTRRIHAVAASPAEAAAEAADWQRTLDGAVLTSAMMARDVSAATRHLAEARQRLGPVEAARYDAELAKTSAAVESERQAAAVEAERRRAGRTYDEILADLRTAAGRSNER